MNGVLKSQLYKRHSWLKRKEESNGRAWAYFLSIPIAFLIMILAEDVNAWVCILVILICIINPALVNLYIKTKTNLLKTGLVIKRDKESGKWEFQPEHIPGMITWDRANGMTYSEREGWRPYHGSYNMILIRDKRGWARIYGSADGLITEIGLWKGRDFQTFHMTDPLITDTVVPVTEEKEEKDLILSNPFSERFAVRKKWMVSEKRTGEFLKNLYEKQDLEESMKGFDFENTTRLIHKLLEKNCYIVPEEYMYDIEYLKEDQKWIYVTECQLEKALGEMQLMRILNKI